MVALYTTTPKPQGNADNSCAEPVFASAGTIVACLLVAAFLRSVWVRLSRKQQITSSSSHATKSLSERQHDADSREEGEAFLEDSLEVEEDEQVRYCPICRSMFLPDTEVCDECGVELVDDPPCPNSSGEDERKTTVRVARITNPIRCKLVVSFLTAQGIPCTVTRMSILGDVGGDIHVFEEDAFHAKRLIVEYLSALEEVASSPSH
jgi:hypothetical protein